MSSLYHTTYMINLECAGALFLMRSGIRHLSPVRHA
jgi:hypothetical protein